MYINLTLDLYLYENDTIIDGKYKIKSLEENKEKKTYLLVLNHINEVNSS